MRPTKETRMRELYGELQWLREKGETFLEHALDRMSALSVAHANDAVVFCLHFGLKGYAITTVREIAVRLHVTPATVVRRKRNALRRLKHPAWKSEETWPPIPTVDAMPETRINEIAVRLVAWRWRQQGTEAYNAELRQAARDLRIEEGEMGLFFTRIGERMFLRTI